jgi:hypothetical protein
MSSSAYEFTTLTGRSHDRASPTVSSELPSSTRMRWSTMAGSSSTVAWRVWAALYAGSTTAMVLLSITATASLQLIDAR